VLACALLLAAGNTFAEGIRCTFGGIGIESDSLCVDVSASGLFDKEVLRGLKKGMTAGVEYQVQVWEKRPNWFDVLAFERIFRMKVSFDSWERKFRLARPDREDVLADEQGIEQQCGTVSRLKIGPRTRLKADASYRLVVRVVFQPMSMENVQEIKRWLSGEADNLNAKSIKTKKSPIKSAGDWMLGFLVNVSGFGDRIATSGSRIIEMENGMPVFRQGE
jgi:hypothetical protein